LEKRKSKGLRFNNECGEPKFERRFNISIKGGFSFNIVGIAGYSTKAFIIHISFGFTGMLMILLACRMFLRHKELASLKFESFNKDISIVKSDFNVQVFGKSDRAPVILQIWRDE
jgi:hypothetical protein